MNNNICNIISYYDIIDETATNRDVINIQCTVKSGPKTGSDGLSDIKCSDTETLVSCGINAYHAPGGARVNPNIKNSCSVLSHDEGNIRARPYAVCCTFPDGAIVDISDVYSNPGTKVSVTCDPDYSLTGCHVYYASGWYNQIKGSFTGIQSGNTPQTSSWISTGNSCTAESTINAMVTASARCIKFSDQYSLDCKTIAKFVSEYDFGQCEAEYNMFGCNAYTNTNSLDSYYRTSSGRCYVRQDNHVALYANAICCQLKKGIILFTD